MSDAELAGLKETWSAFQKEDIDTRFPDTDIVRTGWPKPTMYREHEAIHVLCNTIDHLRREVEEAKKAAVQRADTAFLVGCNYGRAAERALLEGDAP